MLPGLMEVRAPAFRPLCLVDPYLASLEKTEGDPLREIAGINPLTRLWRMRARRG